MPELTLYHAVPSRSMIAHWMLEEVGEPYHIELLDLQAGDQRKPEFLALNPMGRVPTLRHGDVVVTETAAICEYLADAFPSAGLGVPTYSSLRGPYLRWIAFATATAEPSALWRALGNSVAGAQYRPFAELEEVTLTLREAVRGRSYIVGGRFTTADVMIGSIVMWAMRILNVMPEHPELVGYWEGLEKRPAWQRSSTADWAIVDAKEGTPQ